MAEEKDQMLKQVRAKVDDSKHELLYKSPGPHRGSKGRTYDYCHVTTKEEAAQKIEEGWSVSEEEAHELADALKASKKGRKAASDEDDEDGEDLGLAAPVKKSKKGKK